MYDLAYAINKCSQSAVSYIHIEGERYLRLIKTHAPHAMLREYLQRMPEPEIVIVPDDNSVEEKFDGLIALIILRCNKSFKSTLEPIFVDSNNFLL